MSWDPAQTWEPLIAFTAQLTDLRAGHAALRPTDFLTADEVTDAKGKGLGRPQLAWLNGYDGAMKESDWHDGGRRLLGMFTSTADEAVIVWLYAGADPIDVTLPGRPWGDRYHIMLHTGEDGEMPASGETLLPGQVVTIPGRTVVVMGAMYQSPLPAASASTQPSATQAAPPPTTPSAGKPEQAPTTPGAPGPEQAPTR